jgi:hypothetical protein
MKTEIFQSRKKIKKSNIHHRGHEKTIAFLKFLKIYANILRIDSQFDGFVFKYIPLLIEYHHIVKFH